MLYFTTQITEKYSHSNVLGGSLATVDSQQEQDALSALIPTSISSLPSTGGVWIGLSDILREGTFDTWRDDSPVKGYEDRIQFLLFQLDFRLFTLVGNSTSQTMEPLVPSIVYRPGLYLLHVC